MMRSYALAIFTILSLPGWTAAAETLVATTTIRGATVIGPSDVALVSDDTPGALSSAAEAIGMEARVNLYPGRAIRAGDLRAPAVIGRNDIVTLRYHTRGLSIATEGRALDRAARGERLRVLNLASRMTVTAVAVEHGLAQVGDAP